jgi:hypothetical protein
MLEPSGKNSNHSLTIFGHRFGAVWNRTARNNRGSHAPFRSHSLDPFQYLHVASAASSLGNVETLILNAAYAASAPPRRKSDW